MKKTVSLLIVLSALMMILAEPGFAQAKNPRIAILEFTANNTTKAFEAMIRNKMEVALFQTKAFTIVERKQINLVLREQGLQMTMCSDTDCAVQVGKLVSAEYVAVGSIDRLNGYTITLKIISVKKGTVKFGHSEAAKNDNDVQYAVNAIAEIAAKEMTGTEVVLNKEKRKDDQAARQYSGSGSGKSFFSFRQDKSKNINAGLVIVEPVNSYAHRVKTGYGGGLRLEYRDAIVAGIGMEAVKFYSKTDKTGYMFDVPVFGTLGLNMTFWDTISLVPTVSGGAVFSRSVNVGGFQLPAPLNYFNRGTKHAINATVRSGGSLEFHPGSTLKLFAGGYYCMILDNKKHRIKYDYVSVNAGVGAMF